MKKDYSVNYVSVVVPVYNEDGCLQELIDRTLAALDSTGKKFEFIMIDDGSRDSSREIIARAAEARPDQVVGCILNRNYGQHSAIMAGFSIVRGDLIITLDADLQNPPEEIPNLIAAAEKGNERAALAVDSFNYAVKKFVGAYSASMGGINAIVFTAGIGEHSPYIRENSLKDLEYLGIKLDKERNPFHHSSTPVKLSSDDSFVGIM